MQSTILVKVNTAYFKCLCMLILDSDNSKNVSPSHDSNNAKESAMNLLRYHGQKPLNKDQKFVSSLTRVQNKVSLVGKASNSKFEKYHKNELQRFNEICDRNSSVHSEDKSLKSYKTLNNKTQSISNGVRETLKTKTMTNMKSSFESNRSTDKLSQYLQNKASDYDQSKDARLSLESGTFSGTPDSLRYEVRY